MNKSYIKEEALVELSKKVISKEYCTFPTKTHKNPNEFNYEDDLKIPYVTVKTMLQGLNEPTEEEQDLSQMSYSKAKFLERGQGQTEVDLNGLAPTIRAEHHGNIEYRRLSTEHNGKNTDELSKGLIERRLTIRECARLQTFPNDYKFVIKKEGTTRAFKLNASNAYKIIGNAVPPLLAYNIAKRLNEIWNKIF